MNAFIDACNAWASDWGTLVLHLTWQASLLAVLVIVAVRVLHRVPSPVRYALLLVALAKFAVPPLWSSPTGVFSTVSLESASASSESSVSDARTMALPAAGLPNRTAPSLAEQEAATEPAGESTLKVGHPVPTTAAPSAPRLTAARLSLGGWLLLVHALGAGVVLLWVMRQAQSLARVQSRARPIHRGRLYRVLVETARELGVRRVPRLMMSSEVSGPVSCGVLRPCILVPRYVARLEPRRQALVLSHELAHHRRGDLAVSWVQALLSALWWFNPVVWWLQHEIRRVREDCCDDLVLARGISPDDVYCDTLLTASCLRGITAQPAITVALAEHPLGRRFRRIMDGSLSRTPRLSITGIAATLAFAALALPGLGHASPTPSPTREVVTTLEADEVTLTGRVVNARDEPVADASLWLLPQGLRPRTEREFTTLTSSDENGRFELRTDRAALTGRGESILVATRPGFGPAWERLAGANDRDVTLTLAEDDIPITGHVLDLEGRPVAGATLRLLRIRTSEDGDDLGPMLAGFADGTARRERAHYHYLTSTLPAWFLPGFEATTDADGRFELTGIGRERMATLILGGDHVVHEYVHVLTREGEAVRYPESVQSPFSRITTYFAADVEVFASPSRPVVGVVRDSASGEPLAGAEVFYPGIISIENLSAATLNRGLTFVRPCVTGNDGRYELHGLPRAGGLTLMAQRPGRPGVNAYLPATSVAPDSRTLDPVTMDFSLRSAVTIRGRVVNASTGQGVARAEVSYIVPKDSPFRKEAPGFDSWAASQGLQTDAEGYFELAGLPGPAYLGIQARGAFLTLEESGRDLMGVLPDNFVPIQYHAVESFLVDPESESHEVTISLDPGPTHACRVLDPDGKPLAGAHVFGAEPKGHYGSRGWSDEPLATDTVELKSFNPEAPRVILFEHRELGLVGNLEVSDPESPLSVTLQPCGSVHGILVDEFDDPRPNVRLSLSLSSTTFGMDAYLALNQPSEFFTDANGRFQIDRLFPGFDYYLEQEHEAMNIDDNGYVFRGATLEPGETRDLGRVQWKPIR